MGKRRRKHQERTTPTVLPLIKYRWKLLVNDEGKIKAAKELILYSIMEVYQDSAFKFQSINICFPFFESVQRI